MTESGRVSAVEAPIEPAKHGVDDNGAASSG